MRFMSTMILLLTAASLKAGDWPQWRGPNRDGVAPDSPELADAWPAEGLPKVWSSEPLPGGGPAGYGSPVVASGRVYVFSSAKLRVPIATRTFTERMLRELGWFPEQPPQELLGKIEQARVGEERAALKGNALNEWAKQWTERSLDEEQRKKFSRFAVDRLRRGTSAFDLGVLDKLAELKNRKFETQEQFDKWLADSGIPADLKTEVVRLVPTTEDQAQDIITCLGAADGILVWKKEYPGRHHGHGSSSTPCVAGGRVYALGADGAVYCLGAEKGEEVWKVKAGAGEKSCSPMVLDGLVIAPTGPLTAFDAATGEVKWAQKKVAYTHSSPVSWENGGRKFAVCNTGRNVVCVDAQTGEIAWEAPAGGGSSTAVVQGNTMLIFGNGKVGLTAYKLSPDKVEKSWTIEGIGDRGASPLVHKGHVFAVGKFGALCVQIDTGKEVWRTKPGTREISSPLLVDDRILAFGGAGVVVLKADPTGGTVFAKANLGVLGCTSPAFFDGKLVVRGNDAVHCYNLNR